MGGKNKGGGGRGGTAKGERQSSSGGKHLYRKMNINEVESCKGGYVPYQTEKIRSHVRICRQKKRKSSKEEYGFWGGESDSTLQGSTQKNGQTKVNSTDPKKTNNLVRDANLDIPDTSEKILEGGKCRWRTRGSQIYY